MIFNKCRFTNTRGKEQSFFSTTLFPSSQNLLTCWKLKQSLHKMNQSRNPTPNFRSLESSQSSLEANPKPTSSWAPKIRSQYHSRAWKQLSHLAKRPWLWKKALVWRPYGTLKFLQLMRPFRRYDALLWQRKYNTSNFNSKTVRKVRTESCMKVHYDLYLIIFNVLIFFLCLFC